MLSPMAAVVISSSASTSSTSSAIATSSPKSIFCLARLRNRICFPHSFRFPSSSSTTATTPSFSLTLPSLEIIWTARPSAVVGEEKVETTNITSDEEEKEQTPEGKALEVAGLHVRPYELYACNLPRSCDIPELVELFKPLGTVQSVEVSRNAETGVSRGCGYVTMSSLADAKAAIANLDGSDLDGREIRVKFSADMVPGRKNTPAITTPVKGLVFESPYKAYVGNIAWSVTPEDLREYFGQYGSIVSTRLLYDRKAGKNRVYGFVSFSSEEELKAAVASSGTDYKGRSMLVREIAKE